MKRAKVFNITSGTEAGNALETRLNEWLSEKPDITVEDIKFTANENRFIMIIFYDEN